MYLVVSAYGVLLSCVLRVLKEEVDLRELGGREAVYSDGQNAAMVCSSWRRKSK